MKLKVCGINDIDFAVEAERLGVDYLGFIFAPSSPRNLAPEQAASITSRLSGAAKRVGVFVRQSASEILAIMRTAGLDVVQLHRRATAVDVAALREAGFEVWTLAGGAPGDGVLFDSSHGDGETAFRRGPYKTILAGGVSADNLASFVALGPDVLDVNSSLETSPGRKDIARLQEFLFSYGSVADRRISSRLR